MMLPKLEQVRDIEKQFFTNHVGHSWWSIACSIA